MLSLLGLREWGSTCTWFTSRIGRTYWSCVDSCLGSFSGFVLRPVTIYARWGRTIEHNPIPCTRPTRSDHIETQTEYVRVTITTATAAPNLWLGILILSRRLGLGYENPCGGGHSPIFGRPQRQILSDSAILWMSESPEFAFCVAWGCPKLFRDPVFCWHVENAFRYGLFEEWDLYAEVRTRSLGPRMGIYCGLGS